jgi:translation initiation factor 4B
MIRPLLLQKFSSASKYAALSVDGEDEDEGDDCTE